MQKHALLLKYQTLINVETRFMLNEILIFSVIYCIRKHSFLSRNTTTKTSSDAMYLSSYFNCDLHHAILAEMVSVWY